MRVLIIDDSPTEMFKLKSILEKHGHEVIEATDGANGVNVAQKELPDLVLMDVVMPGLNGFQATRQLTKNDQTAHIPVIMVTTKDQETDRVWGKRQGATDYLIKPVEESTLIKTIENALSS
ncbi:MAG: twitching motility response regulator PilH [Pseudomonadales bacterium]|nr:twitching motility response regulator PilH [Pseudomonadales bacterium]